MTDDAATIRRVRELFDAVMDHAPEERREVLLRISSGDSAEIVEEVAALITTDSDTESLPAFSRVRPSRESAQNLIGQRLGAYEVVRHIGNGGMGVVYEAVRADDQYRKRVAIKLVHRGLDSQVTLERFRRERQILANLEHPNIAVLLDGGVAADGRPFLVMEYVDGVPITRWCDDHWSSVRERLELFDQVCEAVQHAHRKLVVHLDIKPGNILVTPDGTVKLLDFGLARLLGGEDEAMPLARGARALTPEYASPEHVNGEQLTTASDVYSLGVVLFELLTGQRPFSGRATAHSDPLARRTPPKPSSIVTSEGAARTSEKKLSRVRASLRGDLDSIVIMALQSEPERRYASVESLRTDIVRHIAERPVRAHPDRAAYRLRKFIRRNLAGVSLTAAVVLALVVGVLSTSTQARRARAEEAKAVELNGFLRSLLSSVGPSTEGRDVPVSEILESAARRIDGQELRPAIRAELEAVIGQSYQSLGKFDDALRHYLKVQSIWEKGAGTSSMGTISAISNVGGAYLARGDLDSAELIFNRAMVLRRATAAPPDTLLATLYGNLGGVAHNRGQPKESERLHRQALGILRNVLPPGDDKIAISMNNLAVALGEQDKWAEAEKMHRDAIAIFRRNHKGIHTLVADAENALATALDIQGKTVAAESAYVSVLRMRRTLLGPTHPDYAFTLFNYASFLADRGRCGESVKFSRQVLAMRGTHIPESHPSIAVSLQTLGRCLDKLGSTADAERALNESLELRRRYLGEKSWLVANSESVLGEHYAARGDFPRAESLLQRADTALTTTLGADSPRTQTNLQRLVALYEAWPRETEASRYRARLKQQ